ncbi:Co-chaperone Hsc20 [Phlegmacium glaucopus]|nr:Co-chaperone Hsc20 [Phlegmacium glaucopus]
MFLLGRRLAAITRLFSNLSCQSCHKPLPSNVPACTSCWSISPISSNISHHALFGLPYEPNPFSVHLPTLKQRFRQAQAACHPDTWATRNPTQQDLAHTLSSRLNEAYQCLSRPLPRAEYILERNGAHTTESDLLEGAPFMLKVMEAREIIDEATPQDRSEIEQLVETTHRDIEDAINQLSSEIERQEWKKAKSAVIRLRYLEGIEKAARKWMDNNT